MEDIEECPCPKQQSDGGGARTTTPCGEDQRGTHGPLSGSVLKSFKRSFGRKELTAVAGEGGGSAHGMKGFKGRGSKKGKAKEGSGGEQYREGSVATREASGVAASVGSKGVHGAMGEGMGSEEGDGATVVSTTGQVVPVHGEGRAMFMGADGRLVGLKRVLLVPGLCANLLSTEALSEAGMKMEMMGTKVFKATVDGRVLWDLRGGKDMYRSMWEIPDHHRGWENDIGGLGFTLAVLAPRYSSCHRHQEPGVDSCGRGDTEEEVQQPTPSPKLPLRRTTQGKCDAVRGGAKEGAAKERPKRAAHPRDFLKYERLGGSKALLVQEEEDEEEKGAEGEME
ncbi:unnamed protein product [Closterium sp. NIES-53]